MNQILQTSLTCRSLAEGVLLKMMETLGRTYRKSWFQFGNFELELAYFAHSAFRLLLCERLIRLRTVKQQLNHLHIKVIKRHGIGCGMNEDSFIPWNILHSAYRVLPFRGLALAKVKTSAGWLEYIKTMGEMALFLTAVINSTERLYISNKLQTSGTNATMSQHMTPFISNVGETLWSTVV